MFKKKECKKCRKKISDTYEFCPYCGNLLNENFKEDWGMLGKNDSMSSINEMRFPIGLNMIFNSLMKNLNRQFGELDKEVKIRKPTMFKKDGISISISTSGNRPPEIRVNSLGNNPKFKQVKKQIKMPSNFSQENLKKFSSLPREEPLTNLRRLSDKVVYEIDLPGVKSISDISIIKLEKSIEIKAVAEDKAYFKLITISLPIINYNLSDGKLVLELGVK